MSFVIIGKEEMLGEQGETLELHFWGKFGAIFPAKSPIFLRSRLRRSRNHWNMLVGNRVKNEPFVRKRSWCILSI